MADAVKAAVARQLPAFKLGQKQVFLYDQFPLTTTVKNAVELTMRPQAKPCHYLPPQRSSPSQRSLLPSTDTIHKVRSPRLPMEPVQCRSQESALVRQAAAPDAARLSFAIVVPPTALKNHDGRVGQAVPMA